MPLPGETLGTAIALNPTSQPQAINGFLNSNDSRNVFYTFTLSSQSSFLIRPPSNSSPGHLNTPDLAILDSTGKVVRINGKPQTSTNSGVLPNLISTVLDPGTYYIRLFSADLPSDRFSSPFISYNLTYQANPDTSGNPPIPYDIAGNTPDLALNLGVLNSYAIADQNYNVVPSRGSFTNILSSNPDDYYKFEISTSYASSSPLNLTVTGLQSNADLQLIQDVNGNGLLDPDEIANAITSNHSGTQDEAIYRIVNPDGAFGRYFIRVNQAGGDTPYTLSISTGEAGELLAGEFEVGHLGATTRTYSGSLGNDNAADLYRFTLLESATVNLQLSGQNGNATLKLFEKRLDGSDRFLQSVNSNTPTGLLSRTLEPGTYYARLTGASGTSYSLNLTANTLLPTTRVSIASNGAQAYGESPYDAAGSFYPSLSADGRYVVFTSLASNLVDRDTNSSPDVFVRDRLTGETSRVSIAFNGTQGNRGATIGGNTPISADGRYVVFTSGSSNLVANDTNGDAELYPWQDAFVHDRLTGKTTRVNVASDGTQANQGGGTIYPVISANGRYVTFSSVASNLVANDTNGDPNDKFSPTGFDVFVHDLLTGETTRESVASDGTQSNNYSLNSQISGDGRYLVFTSGASNLVAGDTNNRPDVFLRDRITGQTTRITPDSAPIGEQGAFISTDGRYISYTSSGNIFLYDRVSQQTTQVSIGIGGAQSNAASYASSLSADGRYVVFNSDASNLVAGDTNGKTDVFVYDHTTAQTTRVSLAYDNSQGNGNSFGKRNAFTAPDTPVISADGRYIAFTSAASNLVEGDTNYAYDIFVRDRDS